MAHLVWLFMFDLKTVLVQNLPSICLLLAKFLMEKMALNSEVLLKWGKPYDYLGITNTVF